MVVVPEAADGQSADGSDSLQLPLLFLKAGPEDGRLRLPSSAGKVGLGHPLEIAWIDLPRFYL
jgi:hypothetical protein